MFQHEGMDRSKSSYAVKYKGRKLPNSGLFEFVFNFSRKMMDEQGWEPGQKLTYGYDNETGSFGFKEFEEGKDLQGWTLQNINLESANCRFARKCREDRGYPLTEDKYGVSLTVSPEKMELDGDSWTMARLPEEVFSGPVEAAQQVPANEEVSAFGQ